MVEDQQRLGRYELTAEIGRGAMGVVYKARDPIIDRVLAIKSVDFRGLGAVQPDVQARFFQEAQSAGRLSHPNIVTIFDAGEADGCAYIAMELLEGPSLREVLDQSAPLSIARALEIAAQIARGLAYAHEHGVVHRDVKPANIILTRRRVKITDFGIARLPYGAAHAQSELAGSPKYMSPEQVRGGSVDGRSDLFALGTVLYEMLTGCQPFVGDGVSAIMQAVLTHEPPAPGTLNAKVPPEVDAFVRRALSKRAEDRHPSARVMLKELSALLKQSGAASDTRTARHAQRRRAVPVDEGEATVLLPRRAAPPARVARRRAWYGAAALLVAGALAFAGWATLGPQGTPRASAGVEQSSPAGETPANVVGSDAAAGDAAPDEAIGGEPAPAPTFTHTVAPVGDRSSAPRSVARRGTAQTGASAAPTGKALPESVAGDIGAPPRVAAAGEKGATLLVAVAPWGEVFVNGQLRGTAPPLTSISVPPGRHRIEIRNGDLPVHAVDVTLSAGDTRRIKYKFE